MIYSSIVHHDIVNFFQKRWTFLESIDPEFCRLELGSFGEEDHRDGVRFSLHHITGHVPTA